MILEAQAGSTDRRCRCGERASSELSYAEEMGEHQGASSASSSDDVPPSSPPTDQSYQTPPVEQVTALVPVPEDVQLPLPNSSEDEIVRVPPPRAPTPGRPVGGQHCWTHCKADVSPDTGAARLFRTSTGIRGKARVRPYPDGSGSSLRGSGSWRFRAYQHPNASKCGTPSSRFRHDRVGDLPMGVDGYGWKAVSSGSDGGAESGGVGPSGSGSTRDCHS